MKKLTDNFINELFKICLRKTQVFEVTQQHLKFNFLPSEQYKEIWQAMVKYHDTADKLMTIGLLTQKFENKTKVIDIINEIKTADDADDSEMLRQLEGFIKNKLFMETYVELHDRFNKDDKIGAFELMGEIAEQLKTFTIDEKTGGFRLFDGFMKRHSDRVERRNEVNGTEKTYKQKVPTGIAPIDRLLYGGIDKGDTFLILADSGVGKSKMMKHIGLSAARRGFNVVHIQAEGTKKEAEEAYDAAIAGMGVSDIGLGALDEKQLAKIDEALMQLQQQGGEIHIKAFEQFDSGTMRDVHSFCQEVQDQYGSIDLLIVDYLDEVEPGDGKKYFSNQDGTRLMKRASAKKFKNICVEFDCAGVTATQANDIADKDKENPEYFLKRGNSSENKKILQPFSYLFTLNRTSNEEKEKIMRLYADKIRKYGVTDRSIPICTNFAHERFYDHKRTVKRFGQYE